MTRSLDQTLDAGALPIAPAVRVGLHESLTRFGRPGPTMNADERLAVCREARSTPRPSVNNPGGAHWILTPAELQATRSVAHDAGGINGALVAGWMGHGLDPFRYIEIISIVSQLSAIDHFVAGVGAPPLPLPSPVTGPPTGRLDDKAAVHTGFVPTAGRAEAPTALSALPDEQAAAMDLHEALYLSPAQMWSNEFDSPLSRPQMEFVAARTSYLNECVY